MTAETAAAVGPDWLTLESVGYAIYILVGTLVLAVAGAC